MNDWTYILLNGTWVFGLALALSVISLNGYVSKVQSPKSQVQSLPLSKAKVPISPSDSFGPGTSVSPIRGIAERLVQTELLWLALVFCLFFFPALPVGLVLLALPVLWV